MDPIRLKRWHPLFERALAIIAEAERAAGSLQWSFGGGTVLMLRHGHRVSTDIDIFVPDPQWIGYLSPRLNEVAESLAQDFDEDAQFLKMRFPEGEIDFVASGWLTPEPFAPEEVLGHVVNLESSAEIVGKKIWFRADRFKARDVFDLATVADREPDAIRSLRSVLDARRDVLQRHLTTRRQDLREEFDSLELIDMSRPFEVCVTAVLKLLS